MKLAPANKMWRYPAGWTAFFIFMGLTGLQRDGEQLYDKPAMWIVGWLGASALLGLTAGWLHWWLKTRKDAKK